MEGQKRELVKAKLHCWELRKWFLWITYVGKILEHLVLWTVHIPQLRNSCPKTQSMIQTWHPVSKYGMTGFPTIYLAFYFCMLLLLLLSRFSRIRLCVTPKTAAHQAPPSLGLSRQEHWSGLPFPSPMPESEMWKWSHPFVTLSDPMDCSLPGSSVHGIFQARVLEWGAIAFSLLTLVLI